MVRKHSSDWNNSKVLMLNEKDIFPLLRIMDLGRATLPHTFSPNYSIFHVDYGRAQCIHLRFASPYTRRTT